MRETGRDAVTYRKALTSLQERVQSLRTMSSTIKFEFMENLPSKPRRKLMHMVDAGANPCGKGDIAKFACKRCGHQSEWLCVTTKEIWRGIPCPKCMNKKR